jgi:hypothetical protein
MAVTEPIIGWFKQHGVKVHEIDGEHDIENIHQQVMSALTDNK